jgi:hypothetical protein
MFSKQSHLYATASKAERQEVQDAFESVHGDSKSHNWLMG